MQRSSNSLLFSTVALTLASISSAQTSQSSLAYRHGYYAGDPNLPVKTQNIAAAPDHYNPMQTAMLYGAPAPTPLEPRRCR